MTADFVSYDTLSWCARPGVQKVYTGPHHEADIVFYQSRGVGMSQSLEWCIRMRESNEKRQRIISRLVRENYNLKKLLPVDLRGRRSYTDIADRIRTLEERVEDLERDLRIAELYREIAERKEHWWQSVHEEKRAKIDGGYSQYLADSPPKN